MKTSIVKIGNSRGIRIPKPVFRQCGFEDEVDMIVHNNELVIRSLHKPREGWEAAFRAMGQAGDDRLVDSAESSVTSWDETEWEWK